MYEDKCCQHEQMWSHQEKATTYCESVQSVSSVPQQIAHFHSKVNTTSGCFCLAAPQMSKNVHIMHDNLQNTLITTIIRTCSSTL